MPGPIMFLVLGVALAACAWLASGFGTGATGSAPFIAAAAAAPRAGKAAKAEAEAVGWVVLSNTYVDTSDTALVAALDELFPGQFLPRNDKNFVIDGPVQGAMFLIQSNVAGAAGFFSLHSVPGPYTQFSPFAKHIADKQLRALAVRQRNWLAVDAIHVHTTEAEAYRLIGALLAKLAPPDAAVLVHPSKPIAMRFNDEVRQWLASGTP